MFGSYGELNARHVDVLCEIGNIGAGNAATSLSVLLDDSIQISAPRVTLLDCGDIVHAFSNHDDNRVAVTIRYSGDVRGAVLLCFGFEDAKSIANMLLGDLDRQCDKEELSDIMLSAIKEIGNILVSSYLGAVSAFTGFNIDISIPFVSIDTASAVMNVPVAELSADDGKILLIEESFSLNAHHLKSQIILFSGIRFLSSIMEKFGMTAGIR